MRRLLLIVGCVIVAVLLAEQRATLQPFSSQIQVALNQLTTGVIPFTTVRIVANGYANFGGTGGFGGYGLRDNAGTIEVKNLAGSWLPLPTSSTLPTAASFWTRVPEVNLSNETAMSLLGTGLILNTTATGVPTIYAGGACANQFIQTLDASGAPTCASVAAATDLSGTVPVANGGTGLTAGTDGGILGFTATGTIASSGLLTANALVIGGGVGVTPSVVGSLGTITTLLHGNASGAPTFGAVVLTTDVSGILGAANGGTGNGFTAFTGPTTSTKTFTLPNASATVLTDNTAVTAAQGGTGQTSYAVGDLLQATGATTLSKLAAVSTGNALISGGVTTASSWGKIGLTTHVTGTLGVTNGGTGFASYTTGDLLYANSGTTLAQLTAPAIGQTLISQGVATAPVWSAALRVSTVSLGANLALSNAAPTISSGFGTGASVTGTAASFRVNVGTGGSATAGVIGMPTAATGWNCSVTNITAVAANVGNARTVQTASATTTVTIQNQTISTGAALVWTASDIVGLSCIAY